MIKQLRRKFLILNLSILSGVFLLILISLFISMYAGEVQASEEIMNRALSEQQNSEPKLQETDAIQNIGYYFYEDSQNNDTSYGAWSDSPNGWEFYEEEPTTQEEENSYWEYDHNYWGFEGWQYQPPDRREHRGEYPWNNGNPWGEEITPPEEETRPMEQPPTEAIHTEVTKFIHEPVITDTSVAQTEKSTTTSTTVVTTVKNVDTVAKVTTEVLKTQTDEIYTTVYLQTTAEKNITSEVTDPETQKPEQASQSTTEISDHAQRESILIQIDDNHIISDVSENGTNPPDMEHLSGAVSKIMGGSGASGKITIDERSYRYKMEQNGNGYRLVLLDRTLELSILTRLLLIFILIACIGIVVIFIISLMLANWTVQPVAMAWDKQKKFVADASHELKAPLAVIATNTELIRSNPTETVESQSKWLGYIKEETGRMSSLVSDLLSVARTENKKRRTFSQELDLSGLVEDVCIAFESLVYEKEKTLHTNIQESIHLLGDKNSVKQLVTILLDNAVVHSSDHAEITVSLTMDAQSKIRLSVSNTARNIPKAQLQKLFDRYYSLDDGNSIKKESSGLGLNIAKNIVENHGGTIEAYSENHLVTFVATF